MHLSKNAVSYFNTQKVNSVNEICTWLTKQENTIHHNQQTGWQLDYVEGGVNYQNISTDLSQWKQEKTLLHEKQLETSGASQGRV